jgi:iron-sulfur cluster assembly accessory protein
MTLTITDAAVHQIRSLIDENPDYRNKGLRIYVEKGGCAGMQYGMEFDGPKEGDERVCREDVEVLVDPGSAGYIKGSTIDYAEGLTGAGFKIINPNAVRSCGCGSSFEKSAEA